MAGSSTLNVDTPFGTQQLDVVETQDDGPVAVVLPALGIRASYYAGFADELTARGAHVVLADFPGHGQSPVRAQRGVDWGYRHLVEEHLPALLQGVRQRFPSQPVIWVGHSLGGQVAQLHAGLAPDSIAGIALVASGSPYYRCYASNALRILAGTQASGVVARALGHYPGHKLGFAGQEASTVIRNWARLARTGRYRFEGFDGEALLARCTAPILAISMEGDDLAPPAAMHDTVDKTASRDVRWHHWVSPKGPLQHNRWPKQPEAPAQRIATWLADLGLLSQPALSEAEQPS